MYPGMPESEAIVDKSPVVVENSRDSRAIFMGFRDL